MRRILFLLPLMIFLLLLVPLFMPVSPPAAPGQNPAHVTQVDAAHYPDVTLYVGVTQPDGRPRGGLTARDFAVTEDGQPVTIADFAGGAGPISTVLVIDRSGSMDENDKLAGAQEAAEAFVEQMRPGDQTAIIAFSNSPELIEPFTADKNQLDRSIRHIRADGSTALYDSLIAGVDELKDAQGRRALLLLTDGRDLIQTGDNTQASRASLNTAIATAVKAGIAVQTIGLGDRAGDERDGIDEGVLRNIADATGGEYFYAPGGDQLAGLYRTLSAGLQQEYMLTYRSPRPFYDGTRRDIRVSVGGAPAATGGYIERHLIDVRSDPRVGVLLLLPVLGALLGPRLLRRKTAASYQPPTTATHDSVPIAIESTPAFGSTIVQPARVVVIPADLARCNSCDAPLLRPGARFCADCGAAQPATQPELLRRIFCDQCGRAMHSGAEFCAYCGVTPPVRLEIGG